MPETVRKRKSWTLMIYMGGFNDLDPFVLEDLQELETVGSTDSVNIIAQFDLAGEAGVARRHYITRNRTGGAFASPEVGHTRTEPNVGDPRELLDFVTFCAKNYPAEHYMLTFWGHGLGVFDKKAADTGRVNLSRAAFSNVPYQLGGALAKPARIEDVLAKLVIIDPETGDALTDREIGELSASLRAALGQRLDVVHFDACYMATLELARQCAAFADHMVASQYIVPYQGMPYGLNGIAALLNGRPAPDRLATGLVEAFRAFYGDRMHKDEIRATISAIDLRRVPALGAALDVLADELKVYIADHPMEALAALSAARERTRPNFGVSPYEWDPGDDIVDLFALARSMEGGGVPQRVADACAAVGALAGEVVRAEAHGGKDFSGSPHLTGLTIYLPKFRGDTANPYPARVMDYPYQYRLNNPHWFGFIDRFQFPTQTVSVDLSGATLEICAAEGAAMLRGGRCDIASFDTAARQVGVSLGAIRLRLGVQRRTEIRWRVQQGAWSCEGRISAAADAEAAIEWDMPTDIAGATLSFSVLEGGQAFEVQQVPVSLFQRRADCLLVCADDDIRLGEEARGSVDYLPLSRVDGLGTRIIAAYADGAVIRSQPRLTDDYGLGPEELRTYLALLEGGGHLVLVGRDIRYAIETAQNAEAQALLAGAGDLGWSEPEFATAGGPVELLPVAGGPLATLPAVQMEAGDLEYADVFTPSVGTVLLQFAGFGACAVLQPCGRGKLSWVGFNLSLLPRPWLVAFLGSFGRIKIPHNQ